MNGWVAILLIAGTTGLVAYLVSRRRGVRVTTVTHTNPSDVAEK